MPSDLWNSEANDPLWVPLLTHYRRSGGAVAVDAARTAAHVRSVRPAVNQFLIAGSTGDGWEIDLESFLQLVAATRSEEVFGGSRLLFGALRETTDEVVDWVRALERDLAERGAPAGEVAGIAVCPPMDPHATQDMIGRHFDTIVASTTLDVAVYQLPQVTGCRIEPKTMVRLAEHPRVTMFKDTSGEDTVARAGGLPNVLLVRGAEGDYIESLQPSGPYHGWLLSTGNVFGPLLRRMIELHKSGQMHRAKELSGVMTGLVAALFDAAQEVPFGNPFSNANRAADHLRATGRRWREAPPPLTASGNTLPYDLLASADDIIGYLPAVPDQGYLPR
jgi:4-hydroxy-tetrahydrodipicolinate synthase